VWLSGNKRKVFELGMFIMVFVVVFVVVVVVAVVVVAALAFAEW
jgi:hypothetical protein